MIQQILHTSLNGLNKHSYVCEKTTNNVDYYFGNN